MTHTADFVVPLVINAVLALVFLSLFIFFRTRVKKIYQPRCDGTPNAVEAPPESLFGWVLSSIRYPTDRLFETHGLDAYMYLRHMRVLVYITFLQSFFGAAVLFAVNHAGGNTTASSDDGLAQISMSNVKAGSNLLVAHLFSVVFNSVVVYFYLYRLYSEYTYYRLKHLHARRPSAFTVMIREVPSSISEDDIKTKIDGKLFPGKLVDFVRARHTPILEKKFAVRAQLLRSLEKAHAVNSKAGNYNRPQHRTVFLVGSKVDSINYFTEKFQKIENEILGLQSKPDTFVSTGVCFATFDSMNIANLCGQVTLVNNTSFLTSPAEEIRNIQWEWLHIGHKSRMIRTMIVNIFMFFLVFFWTVPVAIASGLSNLENLSKVPGLNFLVELIEFSPILTGLVAGFLPTIALTVFFALLVTIITLAAKNQGLYTKSAVEKSVMSKYFYFEIINVFLIYSIVGSVMNSLEEILVESSPMQIVNLLANSLPQQASFFTDYIMLLSMSGHMLALWRPGPLIVRWIKQKFVCKTSRDYREAEAPESFSYGLAYATHTLIFVIVLTYSTISPFILIFAMVYFCLAYLSSSYNIIYVFVGKYEGGARLWPAVFNRICVGVIIYQLVLIGVFYAYKFSYGAIISAACFLATIVFWKCTTDKFLKISKFGVLDNCDDTDNKDLQLFGSYSQPSLQLPEEQLELVDTALNGADAL